MATKYIVNNVTGQTINGESILPKYKVYTALLTQNGGDNFQSITGGSVTEGVSYQPLDVSDGGTWDFSNVGGPVHPEYYSFVATSNEEPNSWDGVGMLGYNTGSPVVTVLENTIGNIWFTYDSTGFYSVNSDGLFINNKTISNIGQDPNFDANGNPVPMCQIYNGNDNYIYISSFYIESGGVGAPTDGMLTNGTPIEIRVYN